MPNNKIFKESFINLFTEIGQAFSVEKDRGQLLESILEKAMKVTNADAGSIYLLEEDKKLHFEIFINHSLDIKTRNKEGLAINSIPLYYLDGTPNLTNISSLCIHQHKTQNIKNAYTTKKYDFTGMREADKRLGYRSCSFLTIPLRNHENQYIGVLQLINAIDKTTNKIIAFTKEKRLMSESLAFQAAIAITNQQLIQGHKDLFESLLHLIAKAIDEKCHYTSKHCTRVPILTLMIANAVNDANEGPFKNLHLTTEEFEELRIAAWLHDCGKITTPEYVMDKATKLQTLTDRLEVIELRLEIIKRDLKIAQLEKYVSQQTIERIEAELNAPLTKLSQTKAFLKRVNQGGEYLSSIDKKEIEDLAKYYYFSCNDTFVPLLSADEVENLSISKGTLNALEREIIQNHVNVTQKILNSLPYPRYLKNVPEIAGNHHERVNGKGYPRGLKGQQMSLQSKILAIADIFEALTAEDRPYKKANTLKEALSIMEKMKNNGHIDPDLYDLFIHDKIYLDYANQYLHHTQNDLT